MDMSDGIAALGLGALPDIAAIGSLAGREDYRATCRVLFADPSIPMARTRDGRVVVFRNAHLRALAALPELGAEAPNVMAKGAFAQLRDPVAAPPGTGGGIMRVVAGQVFTMNPPLHGPARMVLTRQMTPRLTAEMEPLADVVIAELIAEIAPGAAFDFLHSFADRLTARFFGRMIGLTAEEQDEIVAAVRRMGGMFDADPTLDEVHDFDTAAAAYGRIVGDAARRTLASGGNSLVDALAAGLAGLIFADDPDRAGVAPRDVGALLAGNLIDAFHTAALGAANVVLMALRHGGLDSVRETPALLNAAVFEGMRLEPPVLYLNRHALEDIVFEGMVIPKGTTVQMCWGAGNLDPEAFPEPEAYRLDRPMRGATIFGSGAHLCPGRLLATMLAARTLKGLAESRLSFRLDEAGCAWRPRSAMAQMIAMPVVASMSESPANPLVTDVQ